MKCTIFSICAGVVELADARDSKSRGRKAVRVRPPPPAPAKSRGPGQNPGPFHFRWCSPGGGRTGEGRRAAGRGHSSTAPPTRAKSGDVPGGHGARKPRAAQAGIWPMPPDDSCVAFSSSLLRSKWRDRRGLRRETPSSGTIIFQAVSCPMVFTEGSFLSTVPPNCASRPHV